MSTLTHSLLLISVSFYSYTLHLHHPPKHYDNDTVRDCYVLTLMDNSLSVLLEWLNTASQRGITKTADGVQNSDVRELNRYDLLHLPTPISDCTLHCNS